MNFNELYRKIAEIDKQTTADIIEECGMTPMSSPMPQQDNVSMNVSMNGSGAGGIRDLMSILKNIEDTGEQGLTPDLPGDDSIDFGAPGSMMGADDGADELAQMLRLTGQDDGSDKGDDMSDKDMLPGNDGASDKPELDDEPTDGAEDEPEDKPEDESFGNEPNQNYNDVGAVTTDAGDGLNGSKQQIKHGSTPGNNPLPESVKQRLEAKYQQYR